MKKLDEEYKKACAEETPDLWNRIEAGLLPKTEQAMSHTEPPEAAAAQNTGTQPEAAPAQKAGTQTQAAIRKVWIRYGAFVAAAVMVLVTVPGLLRMKSMNRTSMPDTTGTMMTDTSTMPEMDQFSPAGIQNAAGEEYAEVVQEENTTAADSLQEENTTATDSLQGKEDTESGLEDNVSMVLTVTSVEEFEGYELIGVVNEDSSFETKAELSEHVKKDLAVTVTEGETYLFVLKRDMDRDFPGYHILSAEQTKR